MSSIENYLLFGILALLIMNCSTKETTSKSKPSYKLTHTLTLQKTITIPIDKQTSFRSWNIKYYNDITNERELICYENKNTNSILYYDIATKQLVSELKLDVNGPDGVGYIAGFIIKNLDSVFVSNTSRRDLMLVNKKGHVIKRYKLNNNQVDFNSVFITYTYRPMLFDIDSTQIYIVCGPDNDYNAKYFWKGYITGRLNIESGIIEYIYKGPKEYHKKVFGPYFSHHSFTGNNSGKYVFSFPFDNEIIVTDFNKITEKHFAGSEYFDNIPDWDNPANDAEKELRFYIESNSFREIIYDKWRHIYYRFAYKAVDFVDINGRKKTWDDKKPSIIILDSVFNKIGETKLPEGKYYTRDYFVSKEGLYISNSHLKNTKLNENELSFTLFELQKIDSNDS